MEVSPKTATYLVMVEEVMIPFISSAVRHKSITVNAAAFQMQSSYS
jgi:hypothetical protein